MTASELFEALRAPHTDAQETDWLCSAIAEGMDIDEIRDMLDFLECSAKSTTVEQGR